MLLSLHFFHPFFLVFFCASGWGISEEYIHFHDKWKTVFKPSRHCNYFFHTYFVLLLEHFGEGEMLYQSYKMVIFSCMKKFSAPLGTTFCLFLSVFSNFLGLTAGFHTFWLFQRKGAIRKFEGKKIIGDLIFSADFKSTKVKKSKEFLIIFTVDHTFKNL